MTINYCKRVIFGYFIILLVSHSSNASEVIIKGQIDVNEIRKINSFNIPEESFQNEAVKSIYLIPQNIESLVLNLNQVFALTKFGTVAKVFSIGFNNNNELKGVFVLLCCSLR